MTTRTYTVQGMTCAHCAGAVSREVRKVPGVTDVLVDVVWDPPWTLDRMTDEAKLQLGLL